MACAEWCVHASIGKDHELCFSLRARGVMLASAISTCPSYRVIEAVELPPGGRSLKVQPDVDGGCLDCGSGGVRGQHRIRRRRTVLYGSADELFTGSASPARHPSRPRCGDSPPTHTHRRRTSNRTTAQRATLDDRKGSQVMITNTPGGPILVATGYEDRWSLPDCQARPADKQGPSLRPQVEGSTDAPVLATISCRAATCWSKAARPTLVSLADVRGRFPTKRLRISM